MDIYRCLLQLILMVLNGQKMITHPLWIEDSLAETIADWLNEKNTLGGYEAITYDEFLESWENKLI
jgi:hypothetical protein